MFPDLPLKALTSLAEGADRLFAEVALERGVPMVAVLPMAREEYERDFETPESREAFHALLAQAEVIELGPPPTDEQLPPPEGPERALRYAEAGMFIAAHCQVLVALWDGLRSDKRGGTADVVTFRITGRMPGIHAHDIRPEDLIGDFENDLIYHITCSRDRENGGPATGLTPGQVNWLTDDPGAPRTPDIPAHHRRIFEQMQDFNRDWLANRAAIEADRGSLLEGRLFPPAVRRVDEAFGIADWLANLYQRRVTKSLRGLYSLAVLMGLAFVLYSDLYPARPMLWVFLVLFGAGVYMHHQADRGGWHRKYLDYRALAEGLRVQVYWSMAGLSSPGGGRFAHDNFLQKQDIELAWIRHVMRTAALTSDATTEAVGGALHVDGMAFAIREWIGTPKSGQIAYFAARAVERARRNALTERMGRIALWTGIAVAAVLAVAAAHLPDAWHDTLLFTVGALTLIAAVREAYAFRKADKELVKQYRFMHRIFLNARRRLDVAENDAERQSILRALGDAALDEHAEWILMHRERPLEHGKL
jgi:hypothetical protein